jgi:hypothetical protein
MELGAMAGDATVAAPVDDALDQLSVGLDHLFKLVEDGGLDHYDDPGLVGFLQGFEKVGTGYPSSTTSASRRLSSGICRRNCAKARYGGC